jgi:hypothetical protein
LAAFVVVDAWLLFSSSAAPLLGFFLSPPLLARNSPASLFAGGFSSLVAESAARAKSQSLGVT